MSSCTNTSFSKVRSNKPASQKSSKKRKTREEEEENEVLAESAAQDALAGIGESKPKRVRKNKGKSTEEKRLKRFRVKPPLTYLERLDRATTQRMFLIDRKRAPSEDGTHEEEVFDIAATTGNVYQVTVSKVPRCSCPDTEKGNQCKHIIYVLVNVLKAREDLAYQLAFLTSELAHIFASAPETPQSGFEELKASTNNGGQRKPIEGDCPVCIMEFEDKEDIIWCKGVCGNNIHRTCFEQWAKNKPGVAKCVYCRAPWKGDRNSVKDASKGAGKVGADGYVNVAKELGISEDRYMSSYHPHWVTRKYGW